MTGPTGVVQPGDIADRIRSEQGVADLRGLAPRRRAQQIIDRCAHPTTAMPSGITSIGLQAPHLASTRHTCSPKRLSWHTRYIGQGTMRCG